MKSNISIILQARTGSSRLPNKMVLPFYEGQGVLEILLRRLKSHFLNVNMIVATTTNENDNLIANVAHSLEINCFRGDEQDVLGRFIAAAHKYNADRIIRVCADNPFLDMDALDILIRKFDVSDCDYLAYSTHEQIPTIKTHYGFWSEAVRLKTLEYVNQLTSENLFHEHVTNYIYSNSQIFKIGYIEIPQYISENKKIRLTLDTIDDFNLQKEVYKELILNGKDISISNIIQLLDENPMYYEIMKEQINKNSK